MRNWYSFIQERFPLQIYVPFLFLFGTAHLMVFGGGVDLSLHTIVFVLTTTLLFFFVLRLFDELKDYTHDMLLYPKRPLPRGLLTPKDVRIMLAYILSILYVMFALQNGTAFIMISITYLYLYLMYKEFFIAPWLRSKLTTYAITHTVIVVFLSGCLFAVLRDAFIWQGPASFMHFALLGWCLFSLFEFGRKTHITTEERDSILSYSSIFGRHGAVGLTIITLLAVEVLSMSLLERIEILIGLTVYMIVALLGVWYAHSNSKQAVKTYRASIMCSIAMTYLLLIV